MSEDVFAHKPLDVRRMITIGGSGKIELAIATIGSDFASVSHSLTPLEGFELARALEARAYSIIVAECLRNGVEPPLKEGVEGIETRRSLMMERALFQAIGGVRGYFENLSAGFPVAGLLIATKDAGRMFGEALNSVVASVALDGAIAKPVIEQIRHFVHTLHAVGVRGGQERLLFVAGMMETVNETWAATLAPIELELPGPFSKLQDAIARLDANELHQFTMDLIERMNGAPDRTTVAEDLNEALSSFASGGMLEDA